jgi:hypothetical protein
MLILFGGGDGGGIWIDQNGTVHRIPPWTPDVLFSWKAASKLTAATVGLSDGVREEVLGIATKMVADLVGPVIAQAPDAGGDYGIVFFDVDDGFVCGSTGLPPIPIPGPLARGEFGLPG